MTLVATFDDTTTTTDHFPLLGDLMAEPGVVSPDTSVAEVAEEFFRRPDLEAIAVVLEGRPVGLVIRSRFLFTVFRQYGWEIYRRRPISILADADPLMLPDWSRLDVALALALQRDPEHVYDEVIVTGDDGRLRGLLPVRQMVLQQTHALANVIVQKELAHERVREAEEVGRIKSQFLANVTHELRSPVNAIIELAELIRISADQGYVPQVRDRLTLLMSSATSLRSLITNMLDLSKIEAGKMKVFLETFDVVPLLHEVAETTRVLLGRKEVDVVVSTESRSVQIVSDPVKLRQIVLNLASNAAKFTDAGRIVLQQISDATTLSIAVSDTGIGIAADDLKRLFVAFSQVEEAQTKTREGTGLGLAITRELVQMLGGRVSVETEPLRGSTFTVHIPKEPSHESAAHSDRR